MKKLSKSPLVVAIGSALLSNMAMTTVSAETNPFGMTEMSQGYMQLAGVVPADGAPSTGKKAEGEMKCGAGMNMGGDATSKKADGSCGEGKCGAMMDGDKMKKGMESVCGAMMKGKEGACGTTAKDAAPKSASEMSCGAMMNGPDGKAMEGKCAAKK